MALAHTLAGLSRSATGSGSMYRFATPSRPHHLRRFSLTNARSQAYLVWAPDYTDDGALARRMAVRPKHFARANEHIKMGILKVGGGLITPESQDAALADKKFVGSMLLYESDSTEEVRKLIEQDLYWTENVWDKEKLLILPMLMATTLPDKAVATQPIPKDK